MQYDRDERSFSSPLNGIMDRGGTNWILKYTGIFSHNILMSAQYGSNEFDRRTESEADQFCPTIGDRRGGD